MPATISFLLNEQAPPASDAYARVGVPAFAEEHSPSATEEKPIDPARQAVLDGRVQRSLRAREAEKTREAHLRADPLAEVLGPYAVRCVRCGNTIRLSRKSTYELEHWRKHITRCSKRQPGDARPGRTHARNVSTDSIAPVAKTTIGARARAATRTSRSSNTPPAEPAPAETASSARYGTRSTRRQEATKPSPSSSTPEPADATFFALAPVYGVSPPMIPLRFSDATPADEAALDERAVIATFQEQIGRALNLDPPRRGDWTFACLKRTGFAAVSAGGHLPGAPA